MSNKKSTAKPDDAINADSKITAPADVTLPFANPRENLTDVFVRNAVPRQDNYQLWLKQHYDMAYSLGLEKGADGEATQGNGLTLNSDSKKLEIKPAGTTSGLMVTTAGVGVKVKANSGLEPDLTNGLAVKLYSNGPLNIQSDGGLTVKTVINGDSSKHFAGVLRGDHTGLWINVGDPKVSGQRQGLKSYEAKDSEFGATLGIDLDTSGALQFNTAGQVGVKVIPNSSLEITTAGVGVKVKPNSGVENTTSGIGIKVAPNSGVENTTAGVGIKVKPNSGLENTTTGISVKVASGLKVDSGGVDINPTFQNMIRMMGALYGASHYALFDNFFAFFKNNGRGSNGKDHWIMQASVTISAITKLNTKHYEPAKFDDTILFSDANGNAGTIRDTVNSQHIISTAIDVPAGTSMTSGVITISLITQTGIKGSFSTLVNLIP